MCKGVQVHHVVYDLDTHPSWELSVQLAPSQAGDKWRIPQPAQYVTADWNIIHPPEASKKGKKGKASVAAGAFVGGYGDLKRPLEEPTDEAIAAAAKECESSGDAAALRKLGVTIRAAKRACIDELIAAKVKVGLQEMSALLALSRSLQ